LTIHHSHTARSGEPSTLEPTPHSKQSLLLGCCPRMTRIAPLRRDRGARAAAGAFTWAAQGSGTNASNHQARGIGAAGVAVERNPIHQKWTAPRRAYAWSRGPWWASDTRGRRVAYRGGGGRQGPRRTSLRWGLAARSVPAGGSGGGEAAPWLGAERFGGDS